MSNTVTSAEKHGTENLADQADVGTLLLRGGDKGLEVQWDAKAKVTPMGSLVFFAQYVQTGGLLDRLCQGSPLAYSSHNAPKDRDVFGTILLSVLNGQTRYAHINALRGDRVGAEVLGIEKIVSEDSVRRALKRGTALSWDRWLTAQERAVLGVEVMPGKQHGGKHSRPGLWRLLDGLPAHCRPRLIRGDVSYGSEEGMAEAEERRQAYLFKLRQTTKVQQQIRDLERDWDAWADAGAGWQGAECDLKLMGWSRARRCVFLRRSAQKGSAHKVLPASTQGQFDFVERLDSGPVFEYVVGRLVTTGRRKIIRLTSTHALADRIRLTLNRIGQFLNRLARTAEQLSAEAIWAIILSAAFVKWLRGKVLRPVMHGDQVLLHLPA